MIIWCAQWPQARVSFTGRATVICPGRLNWIYFSGSPQDSLYIDMYIDTCSPMNSFTTGNAEWWLRIHQDPYLKDYIKRGH
jgi:hypothetical protein